MRQEILKSNGPQALLASLAPALALAAVIVLVPRAVPALTLSDKMHSTIEKGNRYYDKGEHDKALEAYLEAEKQDSVNVIPPFNAGDALYKLGKFEEGAKEFMKTASSSTDSISAMSYYNLGNTAFKSGDFRSAAEAYKKALLINPNDTDAKFNLEYAMRMLKQEQQQQQQEDQNQKKQDKQDQQNQQNQANQSPDQQKQDKSLESGRPQTSQGEITPDELKRILAAIEASDRNTQEELLKKAAQTRHLTDKDW